MHPNREYGPMEKVLVECDSIASSRCKRFQVIRYREYLHTSLKHNGEYLCWYCSVKKGTGHETMVASRNPDDIREMNRTIKKGMKYKKSGKPRKPNKKRCDAGVKRPSHKVAPNEWEEQPLPE